MEGCLGQHAGGEPGDAARSAGPAHPGAQDGYLPTPPEAMACHLVLHGANTLIWRPKGKAWIWGTQGPWLAGFPLPAQAPHPQASRSMTTLHDPFASARRKPWLAGFPSAGVRGCSLRAPGK